MIKILLAFFLIVSLNHSGQLFGQVSDTCKTRDFEKINVKNVESLLLGKWKYSYSYIDDTCFHIADLGDQLSVNFSFEKADIKMMKLKYPRLYSHRKDRLLSGLVCYTERKTPRGTTYPIAVVIAKDGSFIKIVHHVQGNGVGKAYSYYLRSIEQEKLVVTNETYYSLGLKQVAGVRHVYIRQNSKSFGGK